MHVLEICVDIEKMSMEEVVSLYEAVVCELERRVACSETVSVDSQHVKG